MHFSRQRSYELFQRANVVCLLEYALDHIKSEPLIRVILTGHVHFDFVSNLTPSLTQILTAGGYEGVAREVTLV